MCNDPNVLPDENGCWTPPFGSSTEVEEGVSSVF
jgi:hypothetical protein